MSAPDSQQPITHNSSVNKVASAPYSIAGFGDTLTHDLARGVPAARSFFPVGHWNEVVPLIDRLDYPRAAVCQVLEREARKFNAPEAVFNNIRLLGEPHTYVVATGQQAGFLGGPLYTLHKALSTLALAREYEKQAGGRLRFVPLFWVASDDHDLAEIDHAYLLGLDGALTRVHAALTPESAGCSACDARLDSTPAQLDLLRGQLQSLGFPDAPEKMDEYLSFYREQSLGAAFTGLLYKWLGDLGLIVVQSSDMRAFSRDLLLRELNDYDVTARLIQESAASLAQAGYKAGFSGRTHTAPHFFIASEPSRIRARLEPLSGGDFIERSSAFEARNQTPRTFTHDELAGLIADQPELFSTSAALRPVLQQRIFPVVAAVLGPGEIAYWAQLRKVHEHFGAVWPLVVPRATLTLLDPQGEKSRRKLGLAPDSPNLFLDFEALTRKAISGGETGTKLEAHRTQIMSEFDAMSAQVQAADGGLKPLFDKARERIAHELQRVAEKTKASIDQRDGAGVNRARYLSTLVRPKGEGQERVLCMAQFVARYPSLAHGLLELLDPSAREHWVLTVE